MSSGGQSAQVGRLPRPSNPQGSPRELVSELGQRVGEEAAARWCADLLAGADVYDYVALLPYLGSNCEQAAFDPSWYDYWHRTWGARALLYVWAESAAPVVVEGIADDHWRPAEMCLKVAAKRELGEAGPGAVRLTRHELPRVRVAAIRCLGAVGDTEHVDAVDAAVGDGRVDVRRAAARALEQMAKRLDLQRPATFTI